MNNKKAVSVIIPAYNAADYVKEAVDSALAQTYSDLEVVVVDDGSADNTKKILDPYIAAHKIKYVYQENGGLAGARNTGIKNSSGAYIALLDADDVFLPEKIGRQIMHLESNPDCDVSYCDLYHFWDGEPGKLLKMNYKYYSGADVFPRLLERSFIAPVTVVFRRKIFEKFGFFDEEIRQYAEDWEFWLRISYAGAKICFLPEILAKLRLRHEGSIQGLGNQPKMKTTALKVLERLNQKMSQADRIKYDMNGHLRRYELKTAFAYLLVGDKAQALNFVSSALAGHSVAASLAKFSIKIAPARWLRFICKWLYYRRKMLYLNSV